MESERIVSWDVSILFTTSCDIYFRYLYIIRFHVALFFYAFRQRKIYEEFVISSTRAWFVNMALTFKLLYITKEIISNLKLSQVHMDFDTDAKARISIVLYFENV